MQKRQVVLLLISLMLSASVAYSADYGVNLLGSDPNGASGFGDLTEWTVSSGCSQSTDYFISPPYSLKMGKTASYWQEASIVLDGVEVLGNRSYRWQCSVTANAAVNANQGYFNGIQLFSQGLSSPGVWYMKAGYQTLAASENTITFLIKSPTGDPTYTDRFSYWDDVSIRRECVVPAVSSDNVGGVLATGKANPVTLHVSLLAREGVTERDLIDPDIAIVSNNGTVSDVVRLDDYSVSAIVTPAANGAVELTLTNVYSNKSSAYAMTAATATNCGDAGTLYVSGDLPGARDCYVDLADFAVLAGQWLESSN